MSRECVSLSLLALLLRSLNRSASPKRAQTEQDSLNLGKFSRKVKKNSPPPQMKEPVIIYLISPERIYVEPEEFKAVVQRLTGSSSVAVAAADSFVMNFSCPRFLRNGIWLIMKNGTGHNTRFLRALNSFWFSGTGLLPPPPPSEESSSADGVPEEFDLHDYNSCLSPLNLHLPQVSWKSDSLVLMPTEAAVKCRREDSTSLGRRWRRWRRWWRRRRRLRRRPTLPLPRRWGRMREPRGGGQGLDLFFRARSTSG